MPKSIGKTYTFSYFGPQSTQLRTIFFWQIDTKVLLYTAIQGDLVMKKGRILGLLLSILAIIFAMDYIIDGDGVNTNSFELLGDAGVISDKTATYDNVSLDMDNNSSVRELKFTNTRSYSVTLSQESINMTCSGSGQYKDSDEYLVRNNMKISALFADSNNGVKQKSLNVASGDSATIYITSSYIGDKLPMSEVSCDYKIALQAA